MKKFLYTSAFLSVIAGAFMLGQYFPDLHLITSGSATPPDTLEASIDQKPDTRIFEMRTYYAEPGKLDALLERFRGHTTKLFKNHAMTNIGYWVPKPNDKNQLIYILAYPNMEAREASWKAFMADPEWKKVQTASELNGKLVNHVESVYMEPTDFSKIK